MTQRSGGRILVDQLRIQGCDRPVAKLAFDAVNKWFSPADDTAS